MKNNINLDLLKKYVRKQDRKQTELLEYILDVLQERLSLLDERTEQEWEDAADPKGQEMKILIEAIDFLTQKFPGF